MLFFLDKKEKVQRENPGANGVCVLFRVLIVKTANGCLIRIFDSVG